MKIAKAKRLLLILIFNIFILALSVLYDLLFEKNLISGCIFLKALGFYCPGCGGSRSLNALLDFQPIKSFIYYPPLIISALIILYTDFYTVRSVIKNGNIRMPRFRVFLIIPICIILNFLVRNILLLFGIDILGNIL